jgi:hypothetical protein
LYAIGLVLHTADHLRRGTSVVTTEVLWAGNISTAAGLATIALVLMHHHKAALAAAVLGLPTALAVAAVHLFPTWSVLSDAFVGTTGTGVTPFSWFVVVLEITGAATMGVAGLAEMQRDRVTA